MISLGSSIMSLYHEMLQTLSTREAPVPELEGAHPPLEIASGPVLPGSRQDQVSEEELVRELLYVFQGIPGRLIVKDLVRDGDHLVFKLNCKVDESVRQKVFHLSVMGTLYQRVASFVEAHSLESACSLYQAALSVELRAQLRSYARMLAQLEAEMFSGAPSLLALRLLTLNARRRLEWLVVLVEAVAHRVGANVLATLDPLLCGGNPIALRSLSPLHHRVSEVFYDQLRSWLTGTKVNDPHHEFFIEADPGLEEKPLFSKGYFSVSELLCPQFLSKSQSSRIIKVGRDFRLLLQLLDGRDPLPDLKNELTKTIKTVTQDAELGVTAWTAQGCMHLLVLDLEKQVDKVLCETLLNQGRLLQHLDVLTGFLLLRQSGFAGQLADHLFELLSVPAAQVTRFDLNEKFCLSISNCCSDEQKKVDPEDRIQLTSNPEMDLLTWDCLQIKYNLEPNDPASVILTSEVLCKYYEFFLSMLTLRRMEWTLCDILKSVKTTFRKLRSLTKEETWVLNQVHLIGQEMHRLIQQLLNNILMERLQKEWLCLLQKIKEAPSLAAVDSLHQGFLDSIRIFLFPLQMSALLEQTLELNDLLRSFTLSFEAAGCETATPSKVLFCPSNVPKRLPLLRAEFHELVVQLLSIIKERPEQDLQDLYLFINTNDFFQA